MFISCHLLWFLIRFKIRDVQSNTIESNPVRNHCCVIHVHCTLIAVLIYYVDHSLFVNTLFAAHTCTYTHIDAPTKCVFEMKNI